jgi:hypothetical protein
MSGNHGESWAGGGDDGQEGGSWLRKILRLLGLFLVAAVVFALAVVALTHLPYLGGPVGHHPWVTMFVFLAPISFYLIVREHQRQSGRQAANQRREQRASRRRTESLGIVSDGIASICAACAVKQQENQLLRQRIQALEAGE